jgi:Fur family zinc uptake transcriptional regulator
MDVPNCTELHRTASTIGYNYGYRTSYVMSRTSTAILFPPAHHDHENCVEAALERAEHVCQARGLRLTGLRRRVLELVWGSHKPAGAYEILDSLNREGRKAAPPTVYRALEFLIEADLVHRLDSLNAFVGCRDPGSSHTGQFLICRQCRSVAELDDPDIDELVGQKAAALGFTAVRQMVEIQGLCQDCRAD